MSAPHSTSSDSKIFKAVVPAAGLGTRLRPLTHAFPKELLPVGRRPVLAHIVSELRAAGITQLLFIVSERKPQIRAYFGDTFAGDEAAEIPAVTTDGLSVTTDRPPLHCAYVTQREQRGLGDALLYAQEWVGDDPFVVAFGDCLIDASGATDRAASGPAPLVPTESAFSAACTLPMERAGALPMERLIATHRMHGAGATTLVEEVAWEKVSRYGVLAPEAPLATPPTAPFAAADILEKPARADAPSNLVVAARWVLQPRIFDFLHQSPLDARGERNLTDGVRALRRDGAPLWAVPLQPGEARRDIGNFESFFAASVRAALRDPEWGAAARRVAAEELAAWERRREPDAQK